MPKRGSRLYPQRGKGGGGVPGDRTMAGSQNPNGLSGHFKRVGAYGQSHQMRGPIPPVTKSPDLTPLPNVGQNRFFTPRVGRMRPPKGRPSKGGRSTY